MREETIASDAPATPSHVTPLLPPTAPAPEPARQIHFLKALLLFWLLPGRYGPHLAVGSFGRAFGAHVISVGVGLCAAAPLVFLAEGHGSFSLHALRVGAADVILIAAAGSAGGTVGWALPLVILGAVPVAELGLLALATGLMPWCAGGDSAWSVWRRSVKNVYWATTFVIPLSVIAFAFAAADTSAWLQNAEQYGDDTATILVILLGFPAVGTLVILLLRMLFVGASRYVGEPAGPAFAPREPRCDQCGYLIIGLPLETNCPECGLPVRDSLPGGRRRPTAWQENEFRPRGLAELVRMQWRVFRNAAFFLHIPVQQGLKAARHFWWLTFCLIELVSLAILRLFAAVAPADQFAESLVPLAIMALLAPLLAQAAMMPLGCLWAQWRHGVRDYRVSAVICYYASPLMWPFVLVPAVALFMASDPMASWLAGFRFKLRGLPCDGLELAGVVLAMAFILAAGFWWSRLCAAMHAVRHANV